MKVLLVQGYLGVDPPDSLVYPLGLSYIATALDAAGHEVRICDPNAHADGLKAVARQSAMWQPEVVGVSLRNIDTTDYLHYRYYYRHLPETLDAITGAAPNATIIIGGTGFSAFPERIMRDHPRINFGVVLEGEATIVELLETREAPGRVGGVYIRRGDEVVFTGPRSFSAYPDIAWPRRDFCDLEPYIATERAIGVQSYRGCPLRCAYCNYPALNGRRIRTRTARDVVDEIEDLHRRHGAKEVIFADSLFDLTRSFASDICKEIIKRKLHVRWSAWFETWRFDEGWFELAKRAGCYRFCFSPDGGSDATMAALGKRCQEADVERILNIAARNPDVAFRFTLFCGNKDQDWRDVWRSIRFVLRSHLLLANSRCLLSWTRVFPNSPIYAKLVEQGHIFPEADLLPRQVDDHRALFHIDPGAPRLATPIMRVTWQTAEVLRQARKRVPRLSAWVAKRLAIRARSQNLELGRLEFKIL
jgi:hypothetical protein